MIEESKNKLVHQSLSGLWAYSESGPGGILHLFKIPFTGLIIGSICMTICSCIMHIYQHKQSKYRELLKSLCIALSVKASIAPHTPIGAYIAVFMQTLLALAFLHKSISCPTLCLYCISGMLWNGLQKLITMILFTSLPIIFILQIYGDEIYKILHLNFMQQLIALAIACYLLIHCFAGYFLGRWIYNLLFQFKNNTDIATALWKEYQDFSHKDTANIYPRNNLYKLIIPVFICLLLIVIQLFSSNTVLNRSILPAIYICIYFSIILPVFSKFTAFMSRKMIYKFAAVSNQDIHLNYSSLFNFIYQRNKNNSIKSIFMDLFIIACNPIL
jgi:hypothetical protein